MQTHYGEMMITGIRMRMRMRMSTSTGTWVEVGVLEPELYMQRKLDKLRGTAMGKASKEED